MSIPYMFIFLLKTNQMILMPDDFIWQKESAAVSEFIGLIHPIYPLSGNVHP
jgi:hypothetical protein